MTSFSQFIMPSNRSIIHFVVLPILIAMAIIAGISLSQIQYLSLPIPTVTAGASILLPILTGGGIQGARWLLARSNNLAPKRRSMPAWVLPAFFVGLVIYDTVIAQLSVTHMIPSSTLTCQLFERWETLFDNRDVDAVRRIQDAHQCCGFRTPRHMAWPWPDNQGADQCRRAYRRNRSCLESWRHDQQINAGLLLLVAVASFSAKLLVLILYRTRTPLMQHGRRGYPAFSDSANDRENGVQQEGSSGPHRRIEAPYRDEPTEDAGTRTQEQGSDHATAQGRDGSMTVQPSSLQGHENEWRD